MFEHIRRIRRAIQDADNYREFENKKRNRIQRTEGNWQKGFTISIFTDQYISSSLNFCSPLISQGRI